MKSYGPILDAILKDLSPAKRRLILCKLKQLHKERQAAGANYAKTKP